VEEKTIYLRSANAMAVAHEFGHALDCALGGGVYLSGVDPRIRRAFAAATRFVTPYAATGLDEYFAESLRAFVEINDDLSPWPRVSRRALARIDRAMFRFLSELYAAEFVRSPLIVQSSATSTKFVSSELPP
jgi:hypothetical protein